MNSGISVLSRPKLVEDLGDFGTVRIITRKRSAKLKNQLLSVSIYVLACHTVMPVLACFHLSA